MFSYIINIDCTSLYCAVLYDTVESLRSHLGDGKKWLSQGGGHYGEVGCNVTPVFSGV